MIFFNFYALLFKNSSKVSLTLNLSFFSADILKPFGGRVEDFEFYLYSSSSFILFDESDLFLELERLMLVISVNRVPVDIKLGEFCIKLRESMFFCISMDLLLSFSSYYILSHWSFPLFLRLSNSISMILHYLHSIVVFENSSILTHSISINWLSVVFLFSNCFILFYSSYFSQLAYSN